MKSLFNLTKRIIFLLTLVDTAYASTYQSKTEFQYRLSSNTHSKQNTLQLSESTITPELTIDFDNEWRLNLIARIRHEAINTTRPNTLEKRGYSKVSQPWEIHNNTELELREFYFERSFGNHYVSLGKQQTVWGQADGLKVLDVVNPQSFKEFILEGFEDSRIPLWTAKVELSLDSTSTVQLLWIPDNTVHSLTDRGGTYTFTTPRIVPSIPPGVEATLKELNPPSNFFDGSDFGLRWSAFKNGWDLSLNYLYHYDDLPVFAKIAETNTSPVHVEISPQFNRSHLFGGTFTNSFGNVTIRGEVAFETNKQSLSASSEPPSGLSEHETLSYVLGFDWFGVSDTFISLQFYQKRLLNRSSTSTIPASDTSATLYVRRFFLNETLSLDTLMIHNFNDSDGLIRPKISYNWNDNFSSWLGVDYFYGNRSGLFGQFKSNSRILLGSNFSF